MNNSKPKVDDLVVGKLKTDPVDLKRLNKVVHNEVIKITKFITLMTKRNNLEKKNPIATKLIPRKSIQHRQSQFRKKKLEMLIKKTDRSGLVTTTVLNTKLVKLKIKSLIFLNILTLKNLIS